MKLPSNQIIEIEFFEHSNPPDCNPGGFIDFSKNGAMRLSDVVESIKNGDEFYLKLTRTWVYGSFNPDLYLKV